LQTVDSLKALQDYQVQIAERIARIESKIDDNASEWRDWVADQKESGGGWNYGAHRQFDQPYSRDHDQQQALPSMAEEDSFDIFQDVGSKARILV
jgi:hypothetical protein